MWSMAQRYRLALERSILAKEMPQFQFYNMNGDTYVAGWAKTSGGCQSYKLTLVLGPMYPDVMPELYIISPDTLWKYCHLGTVNAEGVSHAFHTLSNGPGGQVQICHFKPDLWDSSKTVLAVLIKGLVWLEAYEAHLRTGKNLADFCA
jgi:hypothetical protein